MKTGARRIAYLLLLAPIMVFVVLLYFQYYVAAEAPEETPGAPTIEVEVEQGPQVISAEGRVVPTEYVNLGFNTPGMVEAVHVTTGDTVEAGQVIARLAGREKMEAALSAANLELVSALQDLDTLHENAKLASAQAQQGVVDAKEALQEAERAVNNLDYQASEEQIKAAEAAVVLAEQVLNNRREALKEISNKPETNPKRAAAQLAVYAAERQYHIVLGRLNAIKGTASETQIEKATTALALAQANLEKAERERDILEGGPDPDGLALAEARLENAKAQVTAAETNLEDLELRAPMRGTIVRLDLKVGDVVVPGTPRLVIADLTSWQVETTDLAEGDLALLKPGMAATITLDAFLDKEFQGVVRDISYLGEERRGSITYAVTLDFDHGDYPVRWEMSAFVEFILSE